MLSKQSVVVSGSAASPSKSRVSVLILKHVKATYARVALPLTSQRLPSKKQLQHGVPLTATSHLTFLARQLRQACGARFLTTLLDTVSAPPTVASVFVGLGAAWTILIR
jgi:hypothetical protein